MGLRSRLSFLCAVCSIPAFGVLVSVESPGRGYEGARQDGSRDVQQEPAQKPAWAVADSAAAIARARAILGLKDRDQNTLHAQIEIAEKDETPRLRQKVLGRPVWRITVPNWSFALDSSPPGFRDKYKRTVDVVLDAKDGFLVSVRSRWPENEPSIAPEPDAASAAEQMERAGGEKYLEFPIALPAISFLGALDTIQRSGGAPLSSKQIVGQYVVRSTRYHKPRSIWAITFRGVPPIKPPPGLPTDAIYQRRWIVDAETGKWLSMSNIPKPAKQ